MINEEQNNGKEGSRWREWRMRSLCSASFERETEVFNAVWELESEK